MVGFYKHDIPAWMDGTESLSDGAYRAYHVVCQLIYLNEGPIANNEHGIAGRCRQSVRAFRVNLQELIEAGKLRLENGRLANSRAGKELEKIGENRENARGGGEKSGESRNRRAKSLKTADTGEAPLHQDRSLKEKTRLDETRHTPQPPEGGERQPDLRLVAEQPAEPDPFPEFWQAYPRRDGGNPRKPAEESFRRAVRKGVLPADIIQGAHAYAAAMRRSDRIGTSYVAQAATWLNQDRWRDDYRATAPPRAAGNDAFRV